MNKFKKISIYKFKEGELMLFRPKIIFLKEDVLIFFIISIVITVLVERLPETLFYYNKWLYQQREWEKGGSFYQNIFSVKKWKVCLPELSEFIKGWFSKKNLNKNNIVYYQKFIVETCKSEFTHWMIIISSFTFYIWDGFSASVGITFIAFVFNIPYIVIQRYNRPRLIKMMKKYEGDAYEQSTVKVT